jgi:hypothetical protein
MPEVKINLGGRLVALIIGIILFIGVSEVALRFIFPSWNEFGQRFLKSVSVPGHGVVLIGRPNFDGYFSQNNGDFRSHIRINRVGLRNDEPVESADKRIWVIGDSMAFGWGVDRKNIYTATLARYLGLPTYNVASPGTDLCGYQGLLARMPDKIKPKAVVLGLILENDIRKYDCGLEAERQAANPSKPNVERFSFSKLKRWFTGHLAIYNVLTSSLKRVPVLYNLLVKIGLSEKSHAYRGFINDATFNESVVTTIKEIVNLRKMLPMDVPFVVLVAASRFEIRDDDSFYRKLRLSIISKLETSEIPYVDTLVPFKKVGFESTHFKHDGHWEPLGHDIAGKALAKWFNSNFPKP